MYKPPVYISSYSGLVYKSPTCDCSSKHWPKCCVFLCLCVYEYVCIYMCVCVCVFVGF